MAIEVKCLVNIYCFIWLPNVPCIKSEKTAMQKWIIIVDRQKKFQTTLGMQKAELQGANSFKNWKVEHWERVYFSD